MKKAIFRAIPVICLSGYLALQLAACKKDHGDGSGDSCFTKVYAPVDSVKGGNTVKVYDTLYLTVWTTGPSACYDNVTAQDAGLSGTNQTVKAFIQLNNCLDCPVAATPRKGIYKFVANQPGNWTLTFYNNSGNLTYNVTVN